MNRSQIYLRIQFSQIYKTSKTKISVSQSINRESCFRPNLKDPLCSRTPSVRRRVPKLEGDAADSFIHNSMHYSTARFKMDPSTPVSQIAYENRRAIKQALDPKDIVIGMTVVREMVRRGQVNMTREPFERSLHVTNWTAAWRSLDFSPVVKGQEKVQEASRRPKLLVLGEAKVSRRPVGRCESFPPLDPQRLLILSV